jgi:chromate transporter
MNVPDVIPEHEDQPTPLAVRLREVAGVFGVLGWTAFGGPAVHVALMNREIVVKRRWVSAEQFKRMFSACSLIPGPSSTQLVLLLGLLRAGAAGMLTAAFMFVTPAVLIMLAVGELYLRVGSNHVMTAVLLGVDAVVVAIVARAAVDLSSLVTRNPVSAVIGIGALAAALAQVNPLLILTVAALAQVIAVWGRRQIDRRTTPAILLLLPSGRLAGTAALLPLALTFLKIGAVAFGSGYVLLPFLQAYLVGGQFGLTDRQVADAFAISQATPGPVYGLAAFLGVQVAGIAGGIVAAVAIFLPSFVFVPLLNPIIRLVQRYVVVRSGLDGVMVGALGLIASACVVLARASFVGPLEVIAALLAFALLWRKPAAQPLAIVIGIVAGVLTLL